MMMSPQVKIYQVHQARQPIMPDYNWSGEPWCQVEPLTVALYMGDKPSHQPKTKARLLYDQQYLYAIFQVEDQYVRAVAKKYHDPVCQDSCVEFFFTPNDDIKTGYFNAEVNCGGMMLCRHQIAFGTGTLLEIEDCRQFRIQTSLPQIVEPEIATPTTWTASYRIPYQVLEKYCAVVRPAPGATWRANFYKCGDHTSHPHWLTWSLVDLPQPKFHAPEFFGILKFV